MDDELEKELDRQKRLLAALEAEKKSLSLYDKDDTTTETLDVPEYNDNMLRLKSTKDKIALTEARIAKLNKKLKKK